MTTNLNELDHPDKFPAALRKAAQQAYEAAGECESAWQDSHAGAPWIKVARALERCATSIETALSK